MIGWLRGKVRHVDSAGVIILNANGVGYEIHVRYQDLAHIPLDAEISLYIHTHVREDQITLFGFLNEQDKLLFRQLNAVSGIGARTAMNLLSGMTSDELMRAIQASDHTAIARIPGIGKKTAQRIILELRGRLAEEKSATVGIAADVRSALINLGYKPAQVDKALRTVDDTGDFETMLRAALKVLA